ncbi:hypothetical protein WOLCODRAFT_139365 [Wolfiporia cocos MD-104 SS10]|uniref:Uncharacterized protein n=1 Tax=Wolfiporia cocos (strain MD-104) TaxID=742152 RepID=A0A2H3K7H0_WOLCO|nr:hypothetical protein WOLCODRAFT_139365 [Wolfiporia cocos MD-104 SS10]
MTMWRRRTTMWRRRMTMWRRRMKGETEVDDDAEESFEVAEISDPELHRPERAMVTFTKPPQEGRLFWPHTPNPGSSPVVDGESTPAGSAYIRHLHRMEERHLRALETAGVTPARQEHPTRCMRRRAEMVNDEASFPQCGTIASGSRIRGHAGQQGGRIIDRMRRAGEPMKGKKVVTSADTSDVRVSTTTRMLKLHTLSWASDEEASRRDLKEQGPR